MPRFYFDFRSDGRIVVDDVGTEFPSLEEAYLDACQSALEISFEKLRIRSDPHLDSVEILDARRRPLMQVPFSDVLRPKPSRSRARQDQWIGIVSSYQQQLTRGKRLKAEIGEELKKMNTTFGAIRANLERLK
ncbi:DUF6894 family protein [Bradyrhizobium cosmicum]|uniref:DUF6894 family protein n=1 Tax=Bradyrhizobium cosmicum TaxID=1404864 RepID=UPI0028EF3CA8|nr:hypothetical protein [Bradyrhizobium cosmicum]